jgi:hypothetical protein
VELDTSLPDTTHKYEALSYAWGDKPAGLVINVNNEELLVSEDLAIALKLLQFGDEEIILWIDAICIN